MRKVVVTTLSLLLLFNIVMVNTVQSAESAFNQGSSGPKANETSAFGESAFGDSTTGFGASSDRLSWGGSLKFDIRELIDDQLVDNSTTELDLDLDYKKDNSELKTTLNFDSSKEDTANIEETFMRLYYDNFDLVAGKKKVVWGKGDRLHVVDNLTGEDLTDFVNPDYLDRQIGEEMIKLNYYLGNGTLEAVYTPEFTSDQYAESGNWKSSLIENKLGKINKLFGSDLQLGDLEQEDDDGQFALRYTNSKSGYDYGFSLYQGYLRSPSITNANNPSNTKIDYDRVTTLGTEFSSVIAGVNSRAELAYYLTEDRSGTDPTVHNNKVAWLVGGDKDIGLHNVNINLQIKSELVLDKDEVKDNTNLATRKIDIDYNQDGDYFTNLVALEITDKFKNETILPSITLTYNVEDHDYMLDNEIEYKLKDDTSLKLNYKLFAGDEDTNFGQFDDNDYLSATFKYDF
ncbi:hypothetical protein JCM16358_08470 [Halanaerocella petrolearia]